MKKILLALLLTFVPSALFACENTEAVGAPITTAPGISLCRSGYELLYRPEYKTPFWVAEHIEAAEVKGPMVRTDRFKSDPQLPDNLEAQLNDYYRSGYARGHMAPVGDFRNDTQQADESFYLSNMVPQTQKCNNSGVWASIEDITRDWAIHYSELYVVTGPIYSGEASYIGNGVRVPDAMFKVIYNPELNQTISFVVPNIELCKSKPKEFVTTLADVEALTQIKFFPLVKTVDSAKLWQ